MYRRHLPLLHVDQDDRAGLTFSRGSSARFPLGSSVLSYSWPLSLHRRSVHPIALLLSDSWFRPALLPRPRSPLGPSSTRVYDQRAAGAGPVADSVLGQD